MAIKIHTSSAGLSPAALLPGRDLVLHVDMEHGFDLAEGVGVRDHLSTAQRQEIDVLALDALHRWRDHVDPALTIDGICWPFVFELELLGQFIPLVADALALERALLASGERIAVLGDDDPRTSSLLSTVAHRNAIEVQRDPRTIQHIEVPRAGRQTLLRQIRHAAFTSVTTKLGTPTRLRDGSIVMACYWPLMPLLDVLLANPGRRPAVILNSLPTGPGRTLRAAAQGGWIGRPGPRSRASARRHADAALAAAQAPEFALDVAGLALGSELHRAALELIRPQLARRICTAATLRSAFSRRRVSRVVVSFDDEPGGRLVTTLAREAGIPTLLVQHGAYFLPCVVRDLTIADQVAVWSRAVVLQREPDPRFHEVGYPLAHQALPPRRRPVAGAPARVVILPQPWHPSTAVLDSRTWMRHSVIAADAVRAVLPQAEIVIRPHPSDPANLAQRLSERFTGLVVDSQTPILELLTTCDLCIGATTTATLQAALVDTPAVFLNVTGYEWSWPLGGDTAVPIARSENELRSELERWRDGTPVPGRAELLHALGADRPEPTEALLGLLDGPPQPALPSHPPATTTSASPATASGRGLPRWF